MEDKSVNHYLQYKVLFTTQYCRGVLGKKERERLGELIREMQEDMDFTIIELHISSSDVAIRLIHADAKTGIGKLITRIKSKTAKIMRGEFAHLTSRLPSLWTRNSFIISEPAIRQADENQEMLDFLERQRHYNRTKKM